MIHLSVVAFYATYLCARWMSMLRACVHAAYDCNSLACAIAYVTHNRALFVRSRVQVTFVRALGIWQFRRDSCQMFEKTHTHTHTQGYTSKCVRKWPIINTIIAESTQHSVNSVERSRLWQIQLRARPTRAYRVRPAQQRTNRKMHTQTIQFRMRTRDF